MNLFIFITSVLFANFNVSLNKDVEIPYVKNSANKSIYGTNSMKDYYQLSPQLKQLADSTVALVMKDMISFDEKNQVYVRVKNYTFGQTQYLDDGEDFVDNPTLAFCSGSLVAKNLVLTAAHCINDENYKNVKIVFGWKVETPGNFPTVFSNDEVYDVKRIVVRKHDIEGDTLEDFINTYRDYAILELDRDVVGHKPLEIEKSKELNVSDYMFVAGYPSGIPIKVTDPTDSKVALKGKTVYRTNTDLLGGNSGGPAFDSNTGKIIGVVVTGELEYLYQTLKDFNFMIIIDTSIPTGKVLLIKPTENSPVGIRTDEETAKNLISSFKQKGSAITYDDGKYNITIYKGSYFTNREGLSFYVVLSLGGKEVMGKGTIIKYPQDRYGSGILKILPEFNQYIPTR